MLESIRSELTSGLPERTELAHRGSSANGNVREACRPGAGQPAPGRFSGYYARSKRSRFMTLFQAATKSFTNLPCESLAA